MGVARWIARVPNISFIIFFDWLCDMGCHLSPFAIRPANIDCTVIGLAIFLQHCVDPLCTWCLFVSATSNHTISGKANFVRRPSILLVYDTLTVQDWPSLVNTFWHQFGLITDCPPGGRSDVRVNCRGRLTGGLREEGGSTRGWIRNNEWKSYTGI